MSIEEATNIKELRSVCWTERRINKIDGVYLQKSEFLKVQKIFYEGVENEEVLNVSVKDGFIVLTLEGLDISFVK